jgi:hypothetical protein
MSRSEKKRGNEQEFDDHVEAMFERYERGIFTDLLGNPLSRPEELKIRFYQSNNTALPS